MEGHYASKVNFNLKDELVNMISQNWIYKIVSLQSNLY